MRIGKTHNPNSLSEIRTIPEERVNFSELQIFPKEEADSLGDFAFITCDEEGADVARIEYCINEADKKLTIKYCAVSLEYQGQDIGYWLYLRFFDFARENGYREVLSDSVVQGGALAIWYKIQQDSNQEVSVLEKRKDDYEEFCNYYESGRIFKRSIDASREAIFRIIL